MEIRKLEATDFDATGIFHRVYVEVGLHDAPQTFVAAPLEELRNVLGTPTERFEFSAFLGYEGDEVVATGWTAGFRSHNRAHMFVLPRVLPARRRRGYGSTMLTRLEQHAREHGRSMLDAQSRWAASFGEDGRGSPTLEFCAKTGFKLCNTEVAARLELPAGIDQLPALADGYELRAWSGPVPEEIVAQWAELDAGVGVEAPSGELEYDREPPSVERIRDAERVLEETGQIGYNAVIVAPDGELAAYTEMFAQLQTPAPARQGGTYVRPAHRGRGLGFRVKSAVIELIERERPDIPATATQNAIANHQMIAINERLGYVRAGYYGEFQKRLA